MVKRSGPFSLSRALHLLMLVLLPALLMSLNSAQVRSTVLATLADSGLRRIYETEASHPRPPQVEVARPGLNLEPVDTPAASAIALTPYAAPRPAPRDWARPAWHAPPHAPRAPPTLA